MKVNIDKTIMLSDEQRVQIANVLDGKLSRRQATREEVKSFIWNAGEEWAVSLEAAFRHLNGGASEPEAEQDPNPADSQDEMLDLDDLL